MTDDVVRLWEVNHPYYCSEDAECGIHFERWQDFLKDEGGADLDMNLLFRFDWEAPHEDDDPNEPILWKGDENYRDCRLLLFFMGQRKGLFRYATIDVCRSDEPSIRTWLEKRFEHMMSLWEPFSKS